MDTKWWQVSGAALIAIVALSGCATTVKTGSAFDAQKYPEVSFVAFKVAEDTRHDYELVVQKEDTGEMFKFVLNDDVPNSIQVFVGPFIVYTKYLAEKTSPPLKLIPLPVGTYRLKAIQTSVKGTFYTYTTRTESFSVQPGKMTYIGTYQLKLRKVIIFPVGIDCVAVDDGIQRAKAMGLEEILRTDLCRITK